MNDGGPLPIKEHLLNVFIVLFFFVYFFFFIMPTDIKPLSIK
jgi:hypothetical protein